MPFDKNDTNSNNNNQNTNNINLFQINDNNINNDEENNYIPYYYGESPDFSGNHNSGLDAAGQFLYENNINYGSPFKNKYIMPNIYQFQGNSNQTIQITSGLFGLIFG